MVDLVLMSSGGVIIFVFGDNLCVRESRKMGKHRSELEIFGFYINATDTHTHTPKQRSNGQTKCTQLARHITTYIYNIY